MTTLIILSVAYYTGMAMFAGFCIGEIPKEPRFKNFFVNFYVNLILIILFSVFWPIVIALAALAEKTDEIKEE